MQEPDEQGYLMHLWHGNAGAEQLNVTVRLEFPIRIRRRSGNTPTEVKRRDENLLGAIWIPHDKSTFLMMNIRGKENWEIPSRSYTASSDIIGYVYRKIIMPWWRAYWASESHRSTFDEPTIRRQETNTRYRSGVVSLMNDQKVYQKEFKRLSGWTELL